MEEPSKNQLDMWRHPNLADGIEYAMEAADVSDEDVRYAIRIIDTFPFDSGQIERLQGFMIERGLATILDFTNLSWREKMHNLITAFPPDDPGEEKEMHRQVDETPDL